MRQEAVATSTPATPTPGPPSLSTYDDSAVLWGAWSYSPTLSHYPEACPNARCGYTGPSLVTVGVVQPLLNEVFIGEVRADGVTQLVEVLPLARLIAFRCEVCANQRIYDRWGGAGGEFVEIDGEGTQETLF
jgi:hypothetical protein